MAKKNKDEILHDLDADDLAGVVGTRPRPEMTRTFVEITGSD